MSGINISNKLTGYFGIWIYVSTTELYIERTLLAHVWPIGCYEVDVHEFHHPERDMHLRCARTAKRIEVLFAMEARGPKQNVLGGGPDSWKNFTQCVDALHASRSLHALL